LRFTHLSQQMALTRKASGLAKLRDTLEIAV
jgi:hypothetical protein